MHAAACRETITASARQRVCQSEGVREAQSEGAATPALRRRHDRLQHDVPVAVHGCHLRRQISRVVVRAGQRLHAPLPRGVAVGFAATKRNCQPSQNMARRTQLQQWARCTLFMYVQTTASAALTAKSGRRAGWCSEAATWKYHAPLAGSNRPPQQPSHTLSPQCRRALLLLSPPQCERRESANSPTLEHAHTVVPRPVYTCQIFNNFGSTIEERPPAAGRSPPLAGATRRAARAAARGRPRG